MTTTRLEPAARRTRRTPAAHPLDSVPPPQWVEAQPFRALLRQLISDTGLRWRVLARAAGVPPTTVLGLLDGSGVEGGGRIRHQHAQRLYELDSAGLKRLGGEPASCAQVRALVWALGVRGCTATEIAGFIGSDAASVRHLMAGGDAWCSRLMQLCAEAACQAAGVDVDTLLRSLPNSGRRARSA